MIHRKVRSIKQKRSAGIALRRWIQNGSRDLIGYKGTEFNRRNGAVLTCGVVEWMRKDGNNPTLGRGEQKYLLSKKFLDYLLRYVDKAYGLEYTD